MKLRPNPLTVLLRLLSYPPSGWPMLIVVIYLGSVGGVEDLVRVEYLVWDLLWLLGSGTYLAAFFAALIRMGFGSSFEITDTELIYVYPTSFGLGRFERVVVPTGKIKKVAKHTQVFTMYRGRRSIYSFDAHHFLSFDLGGEDVVKMRLYAWNSKRFSALVAQLRKALPGVSFETKRANYYPGKVDLERD